MTKKIKKEMPFEKVLDALIITQRELGKLPQLSPLDKAKFDHSIAIEHLYYSSKIEGTHLTDKKIEKAING